MNIHGKLRANLVLPSFFLLALGLLLAACSNSGGASGGGQEELWKLSGHANIEGAKAEGAADVRGAGANNCARCHTAQGFAQWTKQADMTVILQGKSGAMTIDEMKAIGLTAATVKSQDCTVCHGTTKISGNTSKLPSGYQAVGVGSGALCITCHNTRNGAKGDAVGLPAAYQAPHVAAQGDVLMGENAYFVKTGAVARSKHAFIENTCVTCHMELSPALKEDGKTPLKVAKGVTNHTFKADLSICQTCHGNNYGENLQAAVEAQMAALGTKMSSYIQTKMSAQFVIKDYTPHKVGSKNYDLKSDAMTIDKTNIASIEPTEPHGQQGFLLKFKTPVTFTYKPANEAAHTVTASSTEVQLADFATADGKALIATSDPLVRAGWNYFLIHGDASEGVHNPTFTFNVIQGAIDALK